MVVDAHSHLYPRVYLDLLRARTAIPRVTGEPPHERFVIFPEEAAQGVDGGRPFGPEFWDVAEKLEYMDAAGIDRTVVSLGNPWLDPLPDGEGRAAAVLVNEAFARLEVETGGRIVGLGVLPPGAVEGAVATLEEIAAAPALHGVISGPRICGRELDDPALDPVWAVLERTGLALFLHPRDGAAIDDLGGYGHALPLAIGFPFETTIALARLLFGGVLRRFPGIRVMAAHGGGALPFLAARFDVGWRSDEIARLRLPSEPSEAARALYLDAVLYHPRALAATADLVGTRHMAFGSDHPFFSGSLEQSLEAVRSAFPAGEAAEVLGGTAAELFRLL
jgi:aminocarboxymuconate-semialdehyde decarboxylase